MAKKAKITRRLKASHLPASHTRVIKETLKALKSLEKSGYPAAEYGLGSAYGGSKVPPLDRSKRVPDSIKMTYDA